MYKHFAAGLIAVTLSQAATASPLADRTLVTWNIQTLATPGRKVFNNSTARNKADYDDLRAVERDLDADVYALEEISSPAALALVFPPSEFVLCFSGQWDADAQKLGPQYDFDGLASKGIKPRCFEDATADLPDTAVTPGLQDGKADPLLAQYTAIAVRRTSGIKIDAISDVPRFGVAQNDRDQETGAFVVRNVRWGLDATLLRGESRMHLLVVHMKSGCFDGYLTKKWWSATTDAWQKADKRDHACEVYARQLPALRAWIAQRKAVSDDFVIAGDFNRRPDLELLDTTTPDLWPILTGAETPDPSDDIQLSHVPRDETVATGKACWVGRPPDQNVAIDFFVMSPGVEPPDWQSHARKVLFTEVSRPDGSKVSTASTKAEADSEASRLSDHCPRALKF
ncbi:endonuclease/exonuclease/phosphatase family protein [Agrobacterium cavarae]|uniref:endonuclease/exonuclease/phosphatase family protein n=1 Tax=Agrobacterium cavarae TaxID=2528239 RepID=UPI0028AEC5A6|nr:endonuclease/exonuclease/phosphatase family protein [Agrobacterium cavarae]